MSELKACPFCGSTDLATESFGERRHCVVCEKCECSTGYMLDDDEAIEAWNTRPLEDALRAELEFAKNDLATRLTELAAAQAEVERLRDLTASHAMKLCPGCEKLTEHEKYCEVWECRECGCDSESGFVGLQ